MKSKSESFAFREELIEIINQSNKFAELTELQKANIAKLASNDSLAVVTGQQVGFLGGPLYTMLKAASTISFSEELNSKYESIKFVPVFWVEDNDHDGPEASKAYSLMDNKIKSYNRSGDINSDARQIVGSRTFNNDITSIILNFIEDLPDTPHKEELSSIINEIYQSGESWSRAFIRLLNVIFGEYGLIVISANAVIESGVCSPIIIKELENPGVSLSIINKSNEALDKNGYHIQAKASAVNLFYHENNHRKKIEPEHNSSFISEAQNHPERFSPNVLLRPIFQDFALPTIAYIAGPGEIGYCSQILEVYDFFGVAQPAYIPRHSATILTKKAVKHINKENLAPDYFFTDIDEIISTLSKQLVDEKTSQDIRNIEQTVNAQFDRLKALANQIDPTLSSSADSARTKAIQSIQNIEKKIISAIKRKNSDLLDKYFYTGNLIYPNGSLQERIINPLYFANLTGLTKFAGISLKIAKLNNSEHHIISID